MKYTMAKGIRLNRQMLILIMFLLISTLAVTGFVSAHKKVYVLADGKQVAVDTLYNTPAAVLAQAGIKLGDKDEYRLSTPTLTTGATIEVYRAVPVTLVYRGQTQKIISGKPTVGELLAVAGIAPASTAVTPDRNTKVQANMKIVVTELSARLVEKQLPEPFTVVRRPDANMEKGVEIVAQNGQDGVKVQTIRVHYADTQAVGQEVVSQKVVTPAKPEIIQVGTRDVVETSRGSMRFNRTRTMEATAYNPCDGSGAGVTATGIRARYGVIAVDPRVIPLGTRVYIPGYGVALAADTGSAIVGDRIDLCMEGYNEAMRFGRRTVKVYMLD